MLKSDIYFQYWKTFGNVFCFFLIGVAQLKLPVKRMEVIFCNTSMTNFISAVQNMVRPNKTDKSTSNVCESESSKTETCGIKNFSILVLYILSLISNVAISMSEPLIQMFSSYTPFS